MQTINVFFSIFNLIALRRIFLQFSVSMCPTHFVSLHSATNFVIIPASNQCRLAGRSFETNTVVSQKVTPKRNIYPRASKSPCLQPPLLFFLSMSQSSWHIPIIQSFLAHLDSTIRRGARIDAHLLRGTGKTRHHTHKYVCRHIKYMYINGKGSDREEEPCTQGQWPPTPKSHSQVVNI